MTCHSEDGKEQRDAAVHREIEDLYAFSDFSDEEDLYTLCKLITDVVEFNHCKEEWRRMFGLLGPLRRDIIFNSMEFYVALRGRSMFVSCANTVKRLEVTEGLAQRLRALYDSYDRGNNQTLIDMTDKFSEMTEAQIVKLCEEVAASKDAQSSRTVNNWLGWLLTGRLVTHILNDATRYISLRGEYLYMAGGTTAHTGGGEDLSITEQEHRRRIAPSTADAIRAILKPTRK